MFPICDGSVEVFSFNSSDPSSICLGHIHITRFLLWLKIDACPCVPEVFSNVFFFFSLESHNQWGRPGGPQGAAIGSTGEEAEGEGNSLISQTVAMAIAGTATASPMSRPSSFLLNSQVTPCFWKNLDQMEQSFSSAMVHNLKKHEP